MKSKRLYTIFERDRGTTRWKRCSPYAYHKELAIRVFQSRLLDYMLAGDMRIERRLRPVTKFDRLEAK